jgi:hypothetical protein
MISVFLDTLAARETREEARLLFLEISKLLNQNKCLYRFEEKCCAEVWYKQSTQQGTNRGFPD